MYYRTNGSNINTMFRRIPDAVAMIRGISEYSGINGSVKFYQTSRGVLAVAEIFGLPVSSDKCAGGIFAFHIHSGASCSGNEEDSFADVGTHYNPKDCPHPYHAGDMPPLFSAGDTAFLAFLTDRVSVNEIIGKTVIIHDKPDDFTTQPSGNAGNKIACGEIVAVRR